MANSAFMNGRTKWLFVLILIPLIAVFGFHHARSQESTLVNHRTCLWEICSIDTMKTSRDKARSELNNPSFDNTIRNEIQLINESGANYVAVATPYDDEFLPYLKRWINEARKQKLNVWFRGNWSSWEGWFEYPKNLSPNEHIAKTREFILNNPDLFRDGDIFDACPECENAGHFPQPMRDAEFNIFIQNQKKSLEMTFKQIDKKVLPNIASIIGGRAIEVLNDKTFSELNNIVSIDHYFSDPKNITKYLDYFKEHNTKVVMSEMGAPIPDLHGEMTESEQALFLENVLERLYKSQNVVGINYYVLTLGTTALINSDNSKRQAYSILQKYFQPGIISGKITNTLGEPLNKITINTNDGITTSTNENGEYYFLIPKRVAILTTEHPEYQTSTQEIEIYKNGEKIKRDFVLTPTKSDWMYNIKFYIKDMFGFNVL